jgi:hypothetical protein
MIVAHQIAEAASVACVDRTDKGKNRFVIGHEKLSADYADFADSQVEFLNARESVG